MVINMSKLMFAVFFFLVFLLLVVCAYRVKKRKEPIARNVWYLLITGVVTTAGYMLILLCNSYRILTFGYSVFFASMDWMCYFVLLYALEYTNYREKRKETKYLITGIVIVDCVSVFLNFIFEHATKFEMISSGEDLFLLFRPLFPFHVHMLLCYLLFGSGMLCLLIKIIKSPRCYKIKYGTICAILTAVVILNAVFTYTDIVVDISIFGYAFAAILLHYFTFYYIPRRLEHDMTALVLNRLHDFVIMFDNEGVCIHANDKAKSIFVVGDLDLKDFERIWHFQRNNQREVSVALGPKKRYFTQIFEELRDSKNRYIGCFYVLHETTEEREMQQKQRYMATHDALTGLYNRNYFFEKAEELMKSMPTEKFLIICSDIRQFKAINDIFGVQAGDNLLNAIANELRESDDQKRVYGRIGSDSFALCIPKNNFRQTEYFVRSGRALQLQEVSYPITNHIGIYEVEQQDISVAAMCDRAMLAINSIKEDFQRVIVYYDEHLRQELLQEQEIIKDLNRAFEEEQFTIYVQPQMNHRTQTISGAEALVRWRHPTKGMISPGVFIPLLEGNGMITKLDQCVWELACKQLQKWRQNGKADISISVNISPKDFFYANLYEVFMKLTEKYEIPPSSLKLEITESAFVLDLEKQLEMVEKLQEAGFIIEMDDFGSGYSSLNTLKDIPANVLKLDMAFMTDSVNHSRSADILQMVVAMAQKLHMPVIAEGVETKEQADFLSEIGCDIIQGFYYARPMPVEEYEKMLEKYDYKDLMKSEA